MNLAGTPGYTSSPSSGPSVGGKKRIDLSSLNTQLASNFNTRAKEERNRKVVQYMQDQQKVADEQLGWKNVAKLTGQNIYQMGKSFAQMAGRGIVQSGATLVDLINQRPAAQFADKYIAKIEGPTDLGAFKVPGLGDEPIQSPISRMNDFERRGETPTGKQAAGLMGETALDVASLIYAPAKGFKILKGGKMVNGAIEGALTTGVYGAGYGAATAAEENKSGGDIAKEGAKGFGMGMLIGGPLGATIGKLGEVRTKSILNKITEATDEGDIAKNLRKLGISRPSKELTSKLKDTNHINGVIDEVNNFAEGMGGKTGGKFVDEMFKKKEEFKAEPAKVAEVIGKPKTIPEYMATRNDLQIIKSKNLGTDLEGNKIISRLEWDNNNQKGTLLMTEKATDLHLAHEVGHYIEKKNPDIAKEFLAEVDSVSGGKGNLNEDFAYTVAELIAHPETRIKAPGLSQRLVELGLKLEGEVASVPLPEKMSPEELSSKATNSLEREPGEKPGALERAKKELMEGTSPAVRIRRMEDGTLFVEDGRHRIQAAKELKQKEIKVEDVTAQYEAPKAEVKPVPKKSVPKTSTVESKAKNSKRPSEKAKVVQKAESKKVTESSAKETVKKIKEAPSSVQEVAKKTYKKEVAKGTPKKEAQKKAVEKVEAYEKTVKRVASKQSIIADMIAIRKKQFGPKGRKKVKTDGVNWEHINSAEETEDILKTMFAENDNFKDVRPSRSNQDVIDGARAVGIDMNNEAEVRSLLDTMPNANVVHKLKQSMVDSGSDLMNYLKRIDTGMMTAEQKQMVQFKLARTRYIAETFSGIRTELSHAFRSLGLEAVEGENFAEAVTKLKQMGLEAGDDTISFLGKVNKEMTPGKMDTAMGIWYNSILSGWKTWARNILDNTGALLYESIGKVVNPMTTKEGVSFIANLFRYAPAGISKGFRVMIGKEVGHGKYSPKGYVMKPYFKNNKVNLLLTELSGRVLDGQDVAFSGVIEQAAKASDGFAKKIEGMNLSNVEKESLSEAVISQFKERTTFRSQLNTSSPVGATANGISQITANVKGLKFIVPFTKVVANVIDRQVDYLPFVNLVRTFGKTYINKEVDIILKKTKIPPSKWEALRPVIHQRLKQQQLGRVYLGVLATAGSFMLAKRGLISGSGPKSLAEKQQLQDTGWQPYSFKIGSHWVPYKYLGPLSGVFSAVGSIEDAQRYGRPSDSVWKKTADGLVGFSKGVLSNSFLSGVSDLMDVMQGMKDPVKYANNLVSGILVGAGIPAMYTQTAQLFDRRSFDIQTFGEAVQYRLGYTANLTPRLNALGETVRSQLIFGLTPTKEQNNAQKQLVDRGLKVTKPGETTKLGEEIMTRAQLFEYTAKRGERIRKNLAAILREVDKQKNPDQKRLTLQHYIDEIETQVKTEMMKQYRIKAPTPKKRTEYKELSIKK